MKQLKLDGHTPLIFIARDGIKIEKKETVSALHSQFFYSIIHELKTPLNAISGFSEVLEDEMKEEKISRDACIDYIKEVREAADDLDSLIHDILDLSQVCAKNFSIDTSKKINITDVIKRAVRLNHSYALRCNVSVVLEIDEKIKPINLDAKRMKQIMMNLISNAIKYSRAETTVRIIAKTINDALEISVIDQGFGMNEEQLKIAFEQYGTVANENSGKVDSLGLGLPITKQLVELQNGIIEAKSAIGVGTEIKLIFNT